MTSHSVIDDVLALYRDEPLPVRAFLRGRKLLSRLEFIERFVPYTGTVVELGCGHGLFSNLMALSSGHRTVTGIDLDDRKITVANATVRKRINIEFHHGDITKMSLPEYDAVTIVDVLYLLPVDEQKRVLDVCASILKPGGVLVWKAQERHPKWKYWLTYMQEYIATNVGVTKGKKGSLHFMSRDEALRALSATGLVAEVVEMRTPLPYTDILYLGKKSG